MSINKKTSMLGPWSTAAVAFGVVLAAGPALAGSINVSASTPNSWDYVNITDKSAQIDGSSGAGSQTAEPATLIQLQTTAGAVLNAYCVDLFEYINIPSNDTFNQTTLSAGQSFANGTSGSGATFNGTWSQSQVNMLNALLSNAGSQTLTSQVQTAALQVAIWEVEYGTMTNNAYNLLGSSQNFFFASDGSQDGNSSSVLSLAQTYLNNITSGSWNYNSSYIVEYLTASGTQSLVYLASAPEPSSLAVFGLGLAGVWRARRRRAANK